MKRHPALVPLSHDHHRTLVRARELREAAAGDGEARRAASARFLRHYAGHVVRHFREEEELVFPLLPLQPPMPPTQVSPAGQSLLLMHVCEP